MRSEADRPAPKKLCTREPLDLDNLFEFPKRNWVSYKAGQGLGDSTNSYPETLANHAALIDF
jgi:hypothetical protein